MKSAILFSGGKDSTMALNYAIQKGDDVKYLISIKSKNNESYMFHIPNIDLTQLISEAVDIPLISQNTNGIKEEELKDLKTILQKLANEGIEAIYTGALFSQYQKTRIENITKELNLKCINPYWHMPPEQYMNEVLESGFDVIICGVSAYGLDKKWLGQHINKKTFKELKKICEKYQIHLAFEGGEAETFVLDGPIFKKRIKIIEAETDWNIDNGTYNIKKAILEDK